MKDWRQDQKARDRIRWIRNGMIRRCENPKDRYYHRYGGRGIKVCPEWHNLETFLNWAYESGYDPYSKFMKCTLDRIDNDGDYCPENCKWSDIKEQTKHTCRSNYVTYKGDTRTIIEWSEILGVPVKTMYKRSDLGKSPAEILYPKRLYMELTQKSLEAAIDARIAERSQTC